MRNRWTACLVALVVACNGSTSHGPPGSDASVGADASEQLPDASSGSVRPPGVALCYSTVASTHSATVMFNAALRAGDRSARAAVIDALDAAVDQLPDEEQLHLLLGLGYLWRLAEPLPGEDSPLTQLGDAVGARDHLKQAYQLCPTDHRIPAWLGPIMVRFGRQLNDTAQVNEGLAILDQGIAAYPSFVLFSKLLVYADEPRTAPEFQNALDAVVANIDACNQTPLDPACTNTTVPHNREGGLLFLGDVLTKALDRDGAEAAYTDAMAGADYATWQYQAEVAGRLTDLDARLEAYGNADTSDDPAAAWVAANQCALCHTE